MNNKLFLLLACATLPVFLTLKTKTMTNNLPVSVATPQEIVDLFALEAQTISERTVIMLQEATDTLQTILVIPAHDKTFENTMRSLDTMDARLSTWSNIAYTLSMVSSDEAIRTAAQETVVTVENFFIEHITHNPALYQACDIYYQHNFTTEDLSTEQRYYVTETLKEMRRAGLELPEAVQTQVKQIKKELADLGLTFQTNINSDQRSITVTKDALAGLSDDFIANLISTETDTYILGTDQPTVTQVLEHCSVPATRKALFLASVNRGHPQNSELLKRMIALRDQLAKLLGYASYAQLEIENSMAKSVSTVEAFLDDLAQRAATKIALEMAELQADLPASVTLTETGQFYPWDLAYVKAHYKKKHLQLDGREIAQYFPVEKTIPALLKIYSEFFAVTFQELPSTGLWHLDVRMIRAERAGKLIGYLLLDLYPRPNKYTHACEIDIYKAHKTKPALAVVLVNFPKPTATTPGLLTHHDVVTFFHEFGHALHDLLSNTEMLSFAGTNVKRDFVEMPSQMLEEWVWDAEMLKRVSSHYQTGEPLSDLLIDRLRAMKDFCAADFIQRQLVLSQLSLTCFTAGADKDPHALRQMIYQKLRPYVVYVPEDHYEASFGHLTNYGSRYYGYMWSQVFALDLFEHIKQYGLLNPEIGCAYADKILSKGGSTDPEILLTNFLGRTPNSNAFFRDLGL